MAPHAIVSYDGTRNDHDALMLGSLFHGLGAELTLAYVRHATQARADREQLAEHEALTLLARGAAWLEDPYVHQRVVMSPSTAEGLARLVTEAEADLIVFGSEYRTGRGHVSIGRSAQTLLERGPAAVALAPADYAVGSHEPSTIGVLPGTADEAAIETAYALAERWQATVTASARGVDLLVVGSRPEAREGRVMITASAHNAIEEATAPVLVVARGVPLRFTTLVTV